MLRRTRSTSARAQGARFAIVASQYNGQFVDSMVRAAVRVLRRAGARQVRLVRVPGAYEIPLAAQCLANHHKPRLAAIICLGVILRGETTHAQFIGEAVSRALMRLQLRHELPFIHEVLLLENRQQARVRCLDQKHNRGAEAAQTALAMAAVIAGLRPASGP